MHRTDPHIIICKLIKCMAILNDFLIAMGLHIDASNTKTLPIIVQSASCLQIGLCDTTFMASIQRAILLSYYMRVAVETLHMYGRSRAGHKHVHVLEVH